MTTYDTVDQHGSQQTRQPCGFPPAESAESSADKIPSKSSEQVAQEGAWLTPGIWKGPVILAGILLAQVVYLLTYMPTSRSAIRIVEPKEVGMALFGPYLIGVELASILLLAGMVGAYHLGRHTSGDITKPETRDDIDTHASRTVSSGDFVHAGNSRTTRAT